MPEPALQAPVPTPLTTLTEDEILFRDNIRQFADERIRPHVKEMDEKGIFEKDLIREFFQLGLMGIEIPEQYGGGGGQFFLLSFVGGGIFWGVPPPRVGVVVANKVGHKPTL